MLIPGTKFRTQELPNFVPSPVDISPEPKDVDEDDLPQRTERTSSTNPKTVLDVIIFLLWPANGD